MIDSVIRLDELNTEQRSAVEHTDGPLLIVAGAGTGKTRTLTYRVAHLIESGVHPHHILAITFTNKAASEMRERISELLPKGVSMPMVRTFHSFGVYMLRNHTELFKLPKHFSILDSADQVSLVRKAIKELGLDPSTDDPRTQTRIISRARNEMMSPDEYTRTSSHPKKSTTVRIWKQYELMKQESNTVDFDDLLSKVHTLLSDHPEIREHYQDIFHYIHVDEYQDTNTMQFEIVQLLTGPKKNICVVGDGDQNIYSWRGAQMRNILHFEHDFPGTTVIILEQNYRSTSTILSASDAVIKKNTARIEKTLRPTKGVGPKITLLSALDGSHEARQIATTIQELLHTYKPNDIAILFRTNFQSRALEEAMVFNNIPYQVLGTKFFDRKEVKDILSYIRASLNRDNHVDLDRIINVPKRGLGATSLESIANKETQRLSKRALASYNAFLDLLDRIRTYAHAHPIHELVTYTITETGYDIFLSGGDTEDKDRLENLHELVSFATRYKDMPSDEGLSTFLEEVALLSDQDNMKEREASVRLMTIHAAKGLEFPVVFISGLEQGLFPSSLAGEDRDSEEERRLMYVAMTRAKEKLYLSYAHTRTIFGKTNFQIPSEFLTDIPEDLIEASTEDDPLSESPTVYLL